MPPKKKTSPTQEGSQTVIALEKSVSQYSLENSEMQSRLERMTVKNDKLEKELAEANELHAQALVDRGDVCQFLTLKVDAHESSLLGLEVVITKLKSERLEVETMRKKEVDGIRKEMDAVTNDLKNECKGYLYEIAQLKQFSSQKEEMSRELLELKANLVYREVEYKETVIPC